MISLHFFQYTIMEWSPMQPEDEQDKHWKDISNRDDQILISTTITDIA